MISEGQPSRRGKAVGKKMWMPPLLLSLLQREGSGVDQQTEIVISPIMIGSTLSELYYVGTLFNLKGLVPHENAI